MIRVLIAEDDAAHQRLLQAALKKANPQVEVTVVGTGGDLIRTIREAGPSRFDCLVLDFHLPDYQAHELLKQLVEEVQNIPAIAVSSSNDQRVAIESMRSGTVDFLPKEEALEPGKLWQRIELALLSARRANAERRQLQRRVQCLERLAETDPLTGLFNRHMINELLEDRRRLVDRRGPYSCLMIDLDYFKQINDTYGHSAGDQVLRTIGRILSNATRPDDIVCRWGGEEFLLILPYTSAAAAMGKAEEIRRRVGGTRINHDSTVISLTASIGVVTTENHEEFSEQTIERADEALYMAKNRGRNQVCSGQMVKFEQLLNEVAQSEATSPENRLSTLLHKVQGMIGPVQREHVSEHAHRVCDMAERLGYELGLSDEELDQLHVAGLFHDVGKLLVPEDILNKPGPLSREERYLVDFHSSAGADIGRRLGVDQATAELVRHHHTRFDSADQQNGEWLPFGASIIALADAFVTMTSERSYHTQKSSTEALAELRRERGRQFDPRVVDVAVEALH